MRKLLIPILLVAALAACTEDRPGSAPGTGSGAGLCEARTDAALAAWTYVLFTGRLVSPASVQVIGARGYDLGQAVVAWLPERQQALAAMSNEPQLLTGGTR